MEMTTKTEALPERISHESICKEFGQRSNMKSLSDFKGGVRFAEYQMRDKLRAHAAKLCAAKDAENGQLRKEIEREFAKAARLHDFTVVKTAQGYQLMKIGPLMAQDAAIQESKS